MLMPASIQYPASRIQHPASSIQHPASSIQHPSPKKTPQTSATMILSSLGKKAGTQYTPGFREEFQVPVMISLQEIIGHLFPCTKATPVFVAFQRAWLCQRDIFQVCYVEFQFSSG